MTLRVLGGVLAAALAACGGTSSSVAPCRPSATAGPQQQAGPLTATADRARVARGTTVTFTLNLVGPARLTAACEGPLQLNVVDTAADIHVYDARSAPPGPGRCGVISLGPGQRATYSLPWRPDPTLPVGDYAATLLFGDQPGLTLGISVIANPDPVRCT